jgi:hypothetical protein
LRYLILDKSPEKAIKKISFDPIQAGVLGKTENLENGDWIKNLIPAGTDPRYSPAPKRSGNVNRSARTGFLFSDISRQTKNISSAPSAAPR